MMRLLRAEALKLRTTRTFWGLLTTTTVISGLAVVGRAIVRADHEGDLASNLGLRSIITVSVSGSIFVLLLGVIITAGEHRHGTATDTFLTTPQRWRVITAKLTVAAATGVLFGVAATAVGVAAAAAVYRAEGVAFPAGSSELWATVAGAVLYAGLFGAIGAATGALVRNQVTAIVGWLAWLSLVEHITIAFLPTAGRWLPAAAGRALAREPDGSLLSPATAAVVLAAYATAIVLAAVLSERSRDA